MIRFLIFTLSFLGLLAGVILSFFTKEELKPGKRYFILLQRVLLLTVSLAIICYVGDFFLFFILGLLAGFIFRKDYFYFGLALPLTSGHLLVLLSSLVFIFGLPKGTLLVTEKGCAKRGIILSGIFFSAAVFVSHFLNYTPLLMLVSGALIISSADLKKCWIFPIA